MKCRSFWWKEKQTTNKLKAYFSFFLFFFRIRTFYLVLNETALHVFGVYLSGVCLDYMVILISQGPGGDSSRNKLNLWNKSALSDSHKKTIPPCRVFALAKCDCGSRLSRSAADLEFFFFWFTSSCHNLANLSWTSASYRAISQLRLVNQLFTINIFLCSKIILK